MDLTKLPLFAMMTRRMAWLGQRQQVLAQNIANADTPNYKPRDLKPLDFKSMVRTRLAAVRPRATAPAHLAGARPAGPARTEAAKPVETTLSGNAVVIEEELMKAAGTAMDYELTTNLYRKHVAMIRTALGRFGN